MNWTFPLVAYAALISFFGVVIWKVPHVDLIVIVLIGLALASYDIFSQFFQRGPRQGP